MKSKHNPSQTHSSSNYEQIISDLNRGASFLDLSNIYLTREQLNDLAGRIADNPFIGHIIWGPLPNESRGVVEQIENKLIENNKSYKSHPTDFTHALLSSHAYKTAQVGDKVEFIVDSKGAPHVNAKYNQYLEDWRVEKVFQPEGADDYYSVLYVNDKSHHAVLAHRGTDIPGSIPIIGRNNQSLKADIIEILNHNIGLQQAASYVSTKEALDVSESLGYNFSTTGHSLGAWLAELSLYFCHMDFNYPKVKAVTFDSPGSKDQMEVFKSNVDNTDTKIRTNQFDMVTYLSAPNVVNVCNQHVGTVYRLAPEIKYPEVLKKELPAMLPQTIRNIIAKNKYYLDSLLSVSGHSLTPMLDVFNPETGKPYPDKYALVLDWPHIKHKANTKAGQNLFKGILDNVPVISSLPQVLKAGAIKTISKLVPSSTISSVSNVIASFLSGDTAMSQLCETFRHFDLNTHGKGYKVKKDLPSLEKFALSYKAHYKTQEVNPLQAKLITKYKGSIDWYLSQVAKTNAAILEKGLDEVSSKQLSIIKHGFKTEHISGKNYVSLIEQHQDNIKSIEQFKGYLARLIEVNPTIKSFLENRSGGAAQIIEVRSHQDDYKGNIIVNDLPTRINNFVGRIDIFSKIDHVLKDNQIVAINAFAGTGKSSTALEYGHLQGGIGKIVRWFSSDTTEKIEANYRQLASELGIKLEEINSDHEQGRKNLVNAVNSAIVKLGKPMLLILDNLEYYKDAEEYLVNLPKKLVKVIITTRDSNMLDNPGQHIRLEPFSNEDAAKYISSNLPGRANNKNIEDLIKLLGTKEGEVLPYRLSKAVGFLKENKLWTIPKYIEHIKQNPNVEQAETKLLIESLQGAGSVQGLQILQYAAFLDPDFMSIEIFKDLLNIDEEQLQESIAKLEKLSLVSLNHKDGVAYLKMHRLAQDEVIKYINGQDSAQQDELQQMLPLAEIQQNLIVSLSNLMPKVTSMNNQGDWQVGGLYYPHIQKILDSANGLMLAETGELYQKLGEYNKYALCNYKQSLDQHLEALKTYQAVYVKEVNHSDIAYSLNSMGVAYEYLGQVERSLDYFEQALTMYQALYQGNHPSIANSLNNVGVAYENLGQTEKGLQYKEQALTMNQALYQGNHPSIARSLSNVGVAYENLGQIEKSLGYYEHALTMRQALYQGNHPDIATSLSNLGLAYGNLGQIDKGLEYQEQALTMNQALYQGNHPDIASSLNNVGVAYGNLGQIEKGLQYQEQALTMNQALYQGNHPDIATSLNNVGAAYKNLGQIEKGLQYQEQALTMNQALYPGNHPNIAASLSNLGLAYENLGQTEKGLEYKEQALTMLQALYQGNHPSIATSLDNVGLAYYYLGQVEKSLGYYEHALTMRQALHQGNHPSIATSLSNVGAAYEHFLGQTEKGLQYQEQALTMRQALYQGNHPDIANSLNSVGIAYDNLGQMEKGLEYQEQALTMRQALYQGNHPDIADSLNNVGLAYENLGQMEKGLQYQEQALTMRQALYQGKHPSIATSLNNLGVAYQNLGQIEKGLEYQEQALTMLQALYQGNHPYIANSLDNVGLAYEHLGDKIKALELYKQCYFMRCKVLGKDHPNTQAAKNIIISLDAEFSDIGESRTIISGRGIVDKNIIEVKQKIQKKVLNKIHALASKGDWSSGAFISKPSILGDWGTKRYLSEKSLKKALGKLNSADNVKIAQMLCFEAMCLGAMRNKEKNFNCIKEFAKAYPELLTEIISEHPEYMVDGSIVKLCTKDPATLTRLLGENFSGQGNADYIDADPWMEYTKEGMNELLELRLEAADQRDIKTIMPNYIYDGSEESAQKLANEISANLSEKSLVVLNLFGKHWVGLVIEKGAETIDVSYMNSEQEEMPALLKEQLITQISRNYPEHTIQLIQPEVELQKYNNCGPEVIENITSHLLGGARTTSQEDAVAIHSALFEDSLIPSLSGETFSSGNIGRFNPHTSLYTNSSPLLLENG